MVIRWKSRAQHLISPAKLSWRKLILKQIETSSSNKITKDKNECIYWRSASVSKTYPATVNIVNCHVYNSAKKLRLNSLPTRRMADERPWLLSWETGGPPSWPKFCQFPIQHSSPSSEQSPSPPHPTFASPNFKILVHFCIDFDYLPFFKLETTLKHIKTALNLTLSPKGTERTKKRLELSPSKI